MPSGKHLQTANNGGNKGALEILPYEIWTLNKTQNIVLATMDNKVTYKHLAGVDKNVETSMYACTER